MNGLDDLARQMAPLGAAIVAFGDHAAPTAPFWRKIHFDTAEIWSWQGLPLTGAAYRRHAHVSIAQHRPNSMRAAGAIATG